MYIDAAACALLLIYGLIGYRYGITGAILNLAGMIGGYVAAVYYARPAAIVLAAHTGLAPLLALPLASMLIFLVVTRSFYLLHLIVRKLLEGDKKGPSKLLTVDRMGGLAFGLFKGGVIVGMLLWGLPSIVASSSFAKDAGLEDSQAIGLVRGGIDTVVRYGSTLFTDDPNLQNILARTAAEPRAELSEVAVLATNPTLKSILQDPAVQQDLRAEGPLGLVKSPAFAGAMSDPEFQKGLRGIGFAPPDGRAVSRQEVEQVVRTLTNKLGGVAESLKNSQTATELQTFLTDPAVQEQLRKGSFSQVLNDPRLNHAMGLSASPAPAHGASTEAGGFGPFGVSSRGSRDDAR